MFWWLLEAIVEGSWMFPWYLWLLEVIVGGCWWIVEVVDVSAVVGNGCGWIAKVPDVVDGLVVALDGPQMVLNGWLMVDGWRLRKRTGQQFTG